MAGLLWLWHFAYTPGVAARLAPPEAPVELGGMNGRPLLLVFAHPLCSCSEATIGELARIRTENRQLAIRVFFYTPLENPRAWTDTSLWKDARRIPDVSIQADPGGKLARRFGAATSGQTLVYAADRRLVFAGGITAFRGHYGDNDGHDAISAFLGGKTPPHRATPVFGCGLFRAL